MDRGKIGLKYRLSVTVKRVPGAKLLTLPFKNGCFAIFRIDAGGRKLLGVQRLDRCHFTEECTDFKLTYELDVWQSFQVVIGKMEHKIYHFNKSIVPYSVITQLS